MEDGRIVRAMFLGHYGIAFGAKRLSPRTSLGWLAFAAEFLDELWPILLLAGVEQVRIVPGLMAASALDFVSYPISHSLLMACLWGGLIAALYNRLRRNHTGALVVGVLVVSHWVLDVPVHRPDLPLFPGSSVRVGLGLWNSVPMTIVLEAVVFIGGLLVYLRSTRARDGVGTWGLWVMVGMLVLFFVGGTFGSPPPGERALAIATLGLWLFVPWSWWIDRHRDPATRRSVNSRG
jgi:hypothetical protein